MSSRTVAIWTFINQPIIANSAAVVLVALIGFFFTNFFQCKAQARADSIRIDTVFSEIMHRHSRLLDAIQADLVQEERFEQIKTALDPDTTFLYSEFKGKDEWEVRQEIIRIIQRSNVLPTGVNLHGDPSKSPPPSCDVEKIALHPVLSRPCEADALYSFAHSRSEANGIDFHEWFVNAKMNSSAPMTRAEVLDKMASKKELLLSYTGTSNGQQRDQARIVTAMWNLAAIGQFFPSGMCVCRAVWP